MARWLVESNQLLGVTAEEAIDRLGQPDGGYWDPKFSQSYYLGPGEWAADLYLWLDFDSVGKVARADIATVPW